MSDHFEYDSGRLLGMSESEVRDAVDARLPAATAAATSGPPIPVVIESDARPGRMWCIWVHVDPTSGDRTHVAAAPEPRSDRERQLFELVARYARNHVLPWRRPGIANDAAIRYGRRQVEGFGKRLAILLHACASNRELSDAVLRALLARLDASEQAIDDYHAAERGGRRWAPVTYLELAHWQLHRLLDGVATELGYLPPPAPHSSCCSPVG